MVIATLLEKSLKLTRSKKRTRAILKLAMQPRIIESCTMFPCNKNQQKEIPGKDRYRQKDPSDSDITSPAIDESFSLHPSHTTDLRTIEIETSPSMIHVLSCSRVRRQGRIISHGGRGRKGWEEEMGKEREGGRDCGREGLI
eukprot:747417-Hanusia_phi.AAC.1